ncbi:lysyl-tRNA synthetase [Saxophila tyrrhenica]|uniref:Transcription factor BYE1 n=1 Tax=Saxophila tyrrhenica TaxID=1690608 RepID=A0AAV9NWA4_9PEZI|nr:lysyl-tRNA synthetase [Saxophila tyrrhenica]
MADEPRRSGRATKGQHTNNKPSSSPAPSLPKTTKTAKSKAAKKSVEPTPTPSDAQDEQDDDEVRCICGNTDPNDKRAFIGCDECGVWQHNVCMGITEKEDEVGDSYSCEQCRPQDHAETLQAMARGERIWEVRNKIYATEKKAGKNRKGKKEPGWLKKDVPLEEGATPDQEPQAAGSKRKRPNDEAVKAQSEERQETIKSEQEDVDGKAGQPLARQDKRRKSAAPVSVDPETEIVGIEQLPIDRQKIVTALSKIVADDITARSKAGAYRIPDGHTAKSLGEYYALRIEYSLKMNHGDPASESYRAQFRTLNANLKKNKLLIERLLKKSLTPDELSTMSSSDMASEELQKERAAMKEQLDRQAIVTETEGPRYRRTHKGDELIEDENAQMGFSGASSAQPVRERTSLADAEMADAGSPAGPPEGAASPQRTGAQPLTVNTRGDSNAGMQERRQSSQQFDMNSIWGRTAGSPTAASGPRPLQMPPRRRSSVQQQQVGGGGTKVDADVDRMLQDDDDEAYSPADYTDPDAVVWRGKLVQSADSVAPNVCGRWVAGRDISSTVKWDKLLPDHLNIDGRLAIEKAEDYLCSLQYSSSSDVSVLAFTPADDADAEGFNTFYNYFQSRLRYAVVKDDKPAMVKDLYIIPFEPGETFPPHVGMLETNHMLEHPLQRKTLLASFVIGRAPGTPPVDQGGAVAGNASTAPQQQAVGANGQQVLPQHMRAATQGPAGSPMNPSSSTFSPGAAHNAGFQQQQQQQQQPAGYGTGIPPNPYTPTPPGAAGNQAPPPAWQQHGQQPYPGGPPQGPGQQFANPQIAQILGPFLDCSTAQAVLAADPNLPIEKVMHLRQILEEEPRTRTDLVALGQRLGQFGPR